MKRIKTILCNISFVSLLTSNLFAMNEPKNPTTPPMHNINHPPTILGKRPRDLTKNPLNPFQGLQLGPPKKKRKVKKDTNISQIIQERHINPNFNNKQFFKAIKQVYKSKTVENQILILTKTISQLIKHHLLKIIIKELKPNKPSKDAYTIDFVNQENLLKEKINAYHKEFNKNYINYLAYYCINKKTLCLGQSNTFKSPLEILKVFQGYPNVTRETLNKWTMLFIQEIVQEITKLQDIRLLKIDNNNLSTKNIIDIITQSNITQFSLYYDESMKKELDKHFKKKLEFRNEPGKIGRISYRNRSNFYFSM
jgi:hypothetical protein